MPRSEPSNTPMKGSGVDATGVRVRRQPLTPQTIVAALQAAGKAV